MAQQRGYHHGDLRRAVLDAAIEVISTAGPGAVSLRDLARRAGVSHAAPAHHFKDKAGLLTAIAVEGNELLAAALAGPPAGEAPGLKELGVRYVRFALDHPAHFEVMYRPDLYHGDAAELVAAKRRTADLLRQAVGALAADASGDGRGAGTDVAVLAAWSLAHGFATLWRGGNIDHLVAGAGPAEAFRDVAATAFQGRTDRAP
ncbi:AcrR family transcriptional regulator [Saccharomonospora amisosensis]|uniref:AcrR family transcriptional regulator n=1 Tax=Saccharomonospora amisosensis TaxID=1128677 RepID=A0A7X5ZR00_9PSEU|nr:TetR/AcrR family transcriptional regulator [Saccharomonospora amisosensis]NIJ12368.1 AcrR family transcriptional regulator [Saccharomonospora amisosensis]